MPIVIIKRVSAMIARTRRSLAAAPTPMAGLALGIASLGWCWENAGQFDGRLQLLGAAIAAVLLLVLTFKFLIHPRLLWQDLAHPVVGSVVPTYAMGTMVVSKAVGLLAPTLGQGLWLFAVIIHLVFLPPSSGTGPERLKSITWCRAGSCRRWGSSWLTWPTRAVPSHPWPPACSGSAWPATA